MLMNCSAARPPGFRLRAIAVEIGAPPAQADPFDHLDRSHRIEFALWFRGNPAAGFRSGPPAPLRQPWRPPRPFARSDRVSPTTTAPRFAASIARLPQPQPISSRRWPGCKLEPIQQERNLAALRGLQWLARECEPGRRIGHRRVEPRGVEIIAEVVMGGDIGLGLAGCIVAQAMGERIDPAKQPLGAARLAKRDAVQREQFENRDRVGARPFAQRPRLVPADGSRRRQPHQRHPALELDDCRRPRRRESRGRAGRRPEASFQCRPSGARHQSHPARGRMPAQPGAQPPAADRKAAVRSHQMFAPTRHRLSLAARRPPSGTNVSRLSRERVPKSW